MIKQYTMPDDIRAFVLQIGAPENDAAPVSAVKNDKGSAPVIQAHAL